MIPPRIFIFTICLFLLEGCNVDYEAMAEHRTEYARINQGEIVIAAIQDSDKISYIKGISLAIEEINQSKNRLLGRPLKLYLEQGHNSFKSAKSVIRRIANNPKISVVLGHTKDEVVLPASAIYEKSQLLFFPPFTTTEKLTSHHSLFTFRMLPDNTHMAEQISNLSEKLSFTKVAVLYARAKRHRELGLLFKKTFAGKNLDLVFTRSFFENTDDYRPLLSDLKKKEFDAVLVSASAKTAVRLIKQMREMGIDTPIMGSGDLNSQSFKTSVGIAGNGTIVPTPYNILSNSSINQSFITRYRAKYKQPPDADAALGYDSVMLFVNKAERAKSTLPALLASTIRFSPQWMGITGTYHFNKEGNLEGKNYSFQVLNNKDWQQLHSTLQ